MKSNINIKKILEKVPDYQQFYDTDELNEQSFRLAREYPELVEIKEIGHSKMGKPIYCLKIGNGDKTALAYGTPHPNEPIGSMMLDALCNILVGDPELLQELGFTWYIIKSSDIDGLDRNKGWLKGPYTITNYQRNFFRPAFYQQVEWSFPVQYKKYQFDQPVLETRCIMELMERIRPDFIYSLHNSGFGGAYWYITDGDPELFSSLQEAAKKQRIPLNLGEPETPYGERFADAVFQMTGFRDRYDYLEQNLPDHNAEDVVNGGSCSFEYARRYNPDVRMLVSEVPYFSNPLVSDTSLSDVKRKDALIEGYQIYLEDLDVLKLIDKELGDLFSADNQFFMAAKERMEMSEAVRANLHAIENSDQYDVAATKSQLFDNVNTMKFYSNLSLVLFRRACEEELEQNLSREQADKIRKAKEKAEIRETENLAWMEQSIDYDVIPIRNLVKVQLESGLLYAQYIKQIQH